MSYKPKHCCECGDKIERANWGFMTSRRFCELCETNFRHLDWIPKISLAAAVLLAIFSIGSFFRKPEKTLVVSSNQPSNNSSNSNRNTVSQLGAPPTADLSNAQSATNNSAAQQSKPAAVAAVVKPTEQSKSLNDKQSAAQETVYFCGAQTKKGTPCTRRVKGGGRCWQHAGQTAMLPPEKLITN